MTLDNPFIEKNYYELLGVPRDVDAISLHKAFRLLSKSFHPDTTLLPPDKAKMLFHELKEAYELLSDPQRRKLYDARLNAEASYENTNSQKNFTLKKRPILHVDQFDVRRPLSGGELFSLLLLIASILLSLLLGLVFASAQGKELQVIPNWLPIEETTAHVFYSDLSNVNSSPVSNAT